jgi:glucose 1-dehydrogenase
VTDDFALHPEPARLLAGRRALVTGATSGIGRGTAFELAAHGAAVAIDYRSSPDDADEIVAAIEAAGGRATAVAMDVSSEAEVDRAFGEARDALGGLDLLVNNAGVEAPYLLVEMPLEEWNRVLAVNLTGAFLCAREAARGMIAADAGGGVIVNVSSVHETIPWERFGHYCASKGGMKLWAQTIAKELAPHRVRVVNVAPGAIATPINKDVLEDDVKRRAVEAEIPWGRFGKPEEIAAAVAWLASGEAEYVTGTTLFVDGGMTAYPGFI